MDILGNEIWFNETKQECVARFVLHKKLVLNANVSVHHLRKADIVRKLRATACNLFKTIKKDDNVLFHKFYIKAQICPPTKRRLDPANLNPTIKPILDGGSMPATSKDIGAGIWEDDDYSRLVGVIFTYGGTSGIKDHFVINLTIKEVTGNTCKCWL